MSNILSKKPLAIIIVMSCVILPLVAHAHYPQISPIPNIRISINTSGPLMRFIVSDRETRADNLALAYQTDNPSLIPADDDHITLGGSGQDRTVVITPLLGQYGFANITIILTDEDGDKSTEIFRVQVDRPPNL